MRKALDLLKANKIYYEDVATLEQAVAMAKEYQLTLICAARRDRMKLFNGNNPTE